ncbi:MAG: 30S ribosomal protein S20 [Dehalococcoidia bacterium]
MPARKAARQQVKRNRRNQSVRRATRTVLGHARRTVQAGDVEEAEPAIRQAISVLDKAVKKGVMHKNSASRTKSRLATRLHRLQNASSS